MILDWYFVVQRQCGKSRCVSNAVDPLIACNRHDPRSKGARWCVRVTFGMDREKCILPRIFGCRVGKPSRVIATEPDVQFSKELFVGLVLASLGRGHETAPSLRTPVTILESRYCLRRPRRTNCKVGRRGPLSSIADAWRGAKW